MSGMSSATPLDNDNENRFASTDSDKNYVPLVRWNARAARLVEITQWVNDNCKEPADRSHSLGFPPAIDDCFGDVSLMCPENQCQICFLRKEYHANEQKRKQALMELHKLKAESGDQSEANQEPQQRQGNDADLVVGVDQDKSNSIDEETVSADDDKNQNALIEKLLAQLKAKDAQLKVKDAQLKVKDAQLKVTEARSETRLRWTEAFGTANNRFSINAHNLKEHVQKIRNQYNTNLRVLRELCTVGDGSAADKTPSREDLITSNSNKTELRKTSSSNKLQGRPPLSKTRSHSSGSNTQKPNEQSGKTTFWRNKYLKLDPSEPDLIKKVNDRKFLNGDLERFQKALDKILKRRADNTVKPDVDQICKIIRDWEKESSAQNGIALPSFISTEQEVSHPIIHELLLQVASVTKAEVLISHERVLPENANASARRADFVTSRMTEHQQDLPLYLHFVPIETKALGRKNKSFLALHKEACSQVIGHLASSLIHAMDFAGIGLNCKVYGAVVTMISVEVLELELANAGTGEATILFRRSRKYPLFGEETTTRLFEDGSRNVEYNQVFENRSPYKGFQVLSALTSPAEPQNPFPVDGCYYSDADNGEQQKLSLIKFLGSGTFSNVYEMSEAGSFLKVSRDAKSVERLKSEMELLKLLESDHIPKGPEKLGILRVRFRCEASDLRCMKLQGIVGVAASLFGFKNNDEIKNVGDQVRLALEHAHSKRIVHLDVRPSNIVVLPIKTGNMRTRGSNANRKLQVQLIDWGLAARMEDLFTGFRGTVPYAHDDLLANDKKWRPEPKHDFASLAYTLTTMGHRLETKSSMIPWPNVASHRVLDAAVLKSRKEPTQKFLNVINKLSLICFL